MKFELLLASTLVGLVAGQTASVGSLPACAIPCVNSGIAETGCALSDVHCFCTATAFLCTIAPCVQANCSTADQQNTQSVAQGICNSANPPVELPSFSSLLNGTTCSGASTSGAPRASGTPTAAASESSSAAASSAAASGSGTTASAAASSSAAAKSGSGRIEGDMRVGMALAAMIGVVAVAFFAI